MKINWKEGLKWAALVLGVGVIFTLFLPAATLWVGFKSIDGLPEWSFNGFEIVFGASRTVTGWEYGQNMFVPECFAFNFPLFLAYLFPLLGGLCCFAESRVKTLGWVSVGLFGAGALLTALTSVLLPVGYGELIHRVLDLSDSSLRITVSAAWVFPFVLSLLGCGCALAIQLMKKGEKK